MKHETQKQCYIGVMSGTSMDGVDVVLCPVGEASIELAASMEYPFDAALKTEIFEALDGETTIQKIGEIDHRLGDLFADAVLALIAKYDLDVTRIEAIGLHGQTLWHAPDGEIPFSMQLGNPNILSTRTGIKVVADFRRKDIALGGQGAPFAPAFHQFIFSKLTKRVVVLNLGGMANISVLDSELTGYDTGPGNVLLDGWIAQNRELPFDKEGSWAASGEVDPALLKALLSESYFSQPAPKSTGRELFNMAWLRSKLDKSSRAEDIQATLVELTVCSVINEIRKSDCQLMLVCGGGVKNSYLMGRLREKLDDVEVSSTDEYGVSSDYMEAMAFAWLAYKRLHDESVELKTVTGARSNGILGGIYA